MIGIVVVNIRIRIQIQRCFENMMVVVVVGGGDVGKIELGC